MDVITVTALEVWLNYHFRDVHHGTALDEHVEAIVDQPSHREAFPVLPSTHRAIARKDRPVLALLKGCNIYSLTFLHSLAERGLAHLTRAKRTVLANLRFYAIECMAYNKIVNTLVDNREKDLVRSICIAH